ncbi:VOC family protein [Haloplasma contractile]|uniref:Lactoylglutathione lyase protein n=1 Tax=Haloplasma contractile SSD-17B TaxID=1033810 RepID=U2DTW2_9MOLU|nr:VOC family protein [Haloplasma contractile]ERJ11897.1 lactoylglutathione lyase protein [Haloplasma contractile SSD-17B]
MLQLGSTYLYVNDMDKSLDFYEKLLDIKVTSRNFNRWAQFNFGGNCIALMNQSFDAERFKNNEHLDEYSEDYLDEYRDFHITYGNNFVLNFYIEDLKAEYERLKTLNIGQLSKMMYLNVAGPYHFFTIKDPDGNTIEITGNLKES